MKTSLKLIASFVIIIIVGLSIFYLYRQKPTVIINKKSIAVEIAKTQEERRRGLSSRDKLEDSIGMLFVFDRLDSQIFWNNDMKFSIKVVWLAENKIVGISDLPIDSGENTLVHSPEPVDAVLEITQTTLENANIKVNDHVRVKNVKKNQP